MIDSGDPDYVPGDLGIGGGDYISFSFCRSCGKIQGLGESILRAVVESIAYDAHTTHDAEDFVLALQDDLKDWVDKETRAQRHG